MWTHFQITVLHFFAAVTPRVPLIKEIFTLTHLFRLCLWVTMGRFRSIVCLLFSWFVEFNVIIMTDSSKKQDQLGFEFPSSCDIERCSNDKKLILKIKRRDEPHYFLLIIKLGHVMFMNHQWKKKYITVIGTGFFFNPFCCFLSEHCKKTMSVCIHTEIICPLRPWAASAHSSTALSCG